jgi:tubulin-specific chaperone D
MSRTLLYLIECRTSEGEAGSWIDGAWLYPRALQILRVKEYRKAVLAGLIMSIGSKTEMTVLSLNSKVTRSNLRIQRRPLAAALVAYVESIPVISLQSDEYSMSDLLEDITKYAKTSATSNSVFIPILQTFNILLEADAVRKCQELDTVMKKCDYFSRSHSYVSENDSLSGILVIASRNIERIKNTQRIQEAMKLYMLWIFVLLYTSDTNLG